MKAKASKAGSRPLTTNQIGKIFDEAVNEIALNPSVAPGNIPITPDLPVKTIEGLGALFGTKPNRQ